MKINIERLIDELPIDSVISLHEDLKTRGYYQGIYTEQDLGQVTNDKILDVVKKGIKKPKYSDLYKFAPQNIKDAIKPYLEVPDTDLDLDELKGDTSAETLDDYTNEIDEEQVQKRALILRIKEISSKRDSKGKIPTHRSEEFDNLITELNKNYGVSYSEIGNIIGMSVVSLSSRINKYTAQHPEFGKPLTETRTKVKGKFSTAVKFTDEDISKEQKQTLESEILGEAGKSTEKYINLGKKLYNTYEFEALKQGLMLPVVAMEATAQVLKEGSIYNTMIEIEGENIQLHKTIKQLKDEINRLIRINNNRARIIARCMAKY